MEFLTELTRQIGSVWKGWKAGQRAFFVTAVLSSIGLLVVVGVWATSQEYVVVVDQLTPAQTADAVSTLEAAGIPCKLNFAGSAISVPVKQHSAARLALGEIVVTNGTEENAPAPSIWTDPLLNQERLLRQQEQRLARTISQMKPVRSATVHLTRAESSPFVRDQAPAKASVTLDLQPGSSFSGQDTAAIVSLLAHSVEQLSPDNVTVLSTSGQLLSHSHGLHADVTGQLEYRSMLEAQLSAKAEHLLVPLLGPGNATVRVSADIDFTHTQRTQKVIDAEGKAKLREEIRKESYRGDRGSAFGPPGTASNVPGKSGAAGSSSAGEHESEDVVTEYINGETTDLVRELPGQIRRLSVAAVVQLPSSEGETSAAAGLPAGPSTSATTAEVRIVDQAAVESIIRNAVGLDEARGDQIQVVVSSLSNRPPLPPPVSFPQQLQEYLPLVRAVSIGLGAIVALILGSLILRRLKPVVVERTLDSTLSPEVVERLSRLADEMKQNPDVVTRVMAAWLEDKDEQTESPRQRRAA